MVEIETLEFLSKLRYISVFCPICEGEFDLQEAIQQKGHDDYIVLSSEQDEKEQVYNLVCPEETCKHPQLEVIIGK